MKPTLLVLTLLCSSFFLMAQNQATWQELGSFPSTARERTCSFVIGSTLYVSGGRLNNNSNTDEIWAYDTESESWIGKGAFPGEARRNAVAFSDGEFGYMGLGYNGSSNLTDFWKYDPSNDEWTALSDFPGGPRNWAIGMSSEGGGYLAFGGSASPSFYEKDIWQYTSATDTWTFLTDLPSSPRYRATCFLVEGKIFAGLGTQNGQLGFIDFWEYDIALGSWTQKADFPTENTAGCYFFQVQGICLVGEGSDGLNLSNAGKKLFQYDYDEDTWIENTDFTGTPRVHTFSEAVFGKGYMGTGRSFSSTAAYYDDFYEISVPTNSLSHTNQPIFIKVRPNPFTETLTVDYTLPQGHSETTLSLYNLLGEIYYQKTMTNDTATLSIPATWPAGVYLLRVTSNGITEKVIRVVKML